jgi:1-pyrroline-5-carboxylate dehydrogenase
MIPQFRNEPFTDFTLTANQEGMKTALSKVKGELGQKYPLVIGAEKIETKDQLVSTNPAKPKEVIGSFSKANTELAEQAMRTALAAFDNWKKVCPKDRARYLFRAAARMRAKKFELCSWLILEIGKSWAEADGDVAEAIDFCEYYGREMLRLGGPQPVTILPGEETELYYIPLGVGLVVPPWNFPFAILVGMTMASVVAGNTVILKPSSETPAIAYQLVKIMEEIGLPHGVINFLPGPGASVGDYLVSHPKTRYIAFTGSKEVGLRINELAAKPQAGQLWIKRVIAEMGGKDSIIVDKDTDLDVAADGIVASAFGFQGQKCSACSRAIIDKDIYDEMVKKIVERTRALKMGSPEERTNNYGPVSSKSAYESILSYVEIAKSEGKIECGGAVDTKDGGFYIEPTVVSGVAPQARIAQEEIFGPVLALIKSDDFSHSLDVANNTEFGLTGAVYSNSRENLERARREFHVGNLYLNRKCTGAMVGAHPFGGFNMSGTDSKAGGPDYILLFTQGKSVAEKF